MGFGIRRASKRLRLVKRGWGLGAFAALLSACTFPDFVVLPATGGTSTSASGSGNGNGNAGGPNGAMNGGGNSASGSAGTDGGDAAGSGTGGAGGTSQSGNSGTTGDGDGEGGGGGDVLEPAPPDPGPCGQRPHPTHCWNGKADVDETDVDCGGPRCAPCAAEESCALKRDCSAGNCSLGKCERLFSLSYLAEVDDEETASIRFKAVLSYAGTQPISLSDVSVRYAFSRNDVLEPMLPGGSAFVLPARDDISGAVQWNVVRQLRGDGLTNDAYLDVGFAKGRILTQGSSLEVNPSLVTADGKSLFNQKTHHSFDDGATLHESKKVAVYFKGQRAWGRGPQIDDPPSCLSLGVNLDGAAVNVGGEDWLTSPPSVLDRYINQDVTLKPSTDKGREEMLRAGFFFHGDSFAYSVNNGTYSLVVYVWAADGAETATLKIQGKERDRFRAISFAGGGPWVGLGPYRVSIDKGQLSLGSVGDLRVGGIELRTLDE